MGKKMHFRLISILTILAISLAVVAGVSSAAPARSSHATYQGALVVHFYENNGTTRTGAGATVHCQNASTGYTATSTTDGNGIAYCFTPVNTCWWVWGTFPQNYYWGSFNGNWAVYQCVGSLGGTYDVYLRLISW